MEEVICEQSKVKDMELKGYMDSVDQLCWDFKYVDLLVMVLGDKIVCFWDVCGEYL